MGSEIPPGQPFDEDRDESGTPRYGYGQMLEALKGADLDGLARAVKRHLAQDRVGFGTQPFVVDPIPRLIGGNEWGELERGLAQRTRALNGFLADIYGDRRIVAAGIVPEEVIGGAEGYERALAGRPPASSPPAAIIGFDLVREPGGAYLVLEDNLRTPSGYTYLLAARRALQDTLPPGMPVPRPIDPVIYDLLGATLRAAAPAATGDDPVIVLLTDGPGNVAYYEHSHAAERLGIALVTLDDLAPDGDGLSARLPDGDISSVDVVYRRTDEDRVRDERGRLTRVAEMLVEPWLNKKIGLVNAFGNGVADDKLVHSHVEDFVRFYLDEEPLVRSVPTQALDSGEARKEAVGRLRELVIKPRHGHGGMGVTIGSHVDEDELSRVAAEVSEHGERYIAQPIVPLSRHPTVIDGQLEHRHVDLRPFAFCAGGEVALSPGGLSRVAFDAGEMVVNSSRRGGGKDTWVLD
jgi:uncharacterized circularly permuted ATP-grasp superfamily protein